MLLITIGTGVLLFATVIVLDNIIVSQLKREFDLTLLNKTRTLITLTTQETGKIELNFADEFMPEYETKKRPDYFQLRYLNGKLVERSHSLMGKDFPVPKLDLNQERFSNIRLIDGRAGRLVEIRFIPHIQDGARKEQQGNEPTHDQTGRKLSDTQALISVARGREQLDVLIVSMRFKLGSLFLLLVFAIVFLVRFIVARSLAPLRSISHSVQQLDASTLDVRIHDHSNVAELAPISRQINSLLQRLEEAFQREKRFSSNAAHELRTPLAELKTIAEVGGMWPNDEQMVKGFFTDLQGITSDMENIVTNLLVLARCDVGREVISKSDVELSKIVDESWHRLRQNIARKGIIINQSGESAIVQTDRGKLEIILINLFSNAVEYSPDNGYVNIRLERKPNGVGIEVDNSAPNLSETDLPKLFDRFWRKDGVASSKQHAGLGLPLVMALAEIMGIKLVTSLGADHRFTVSLLIT